MSNRIDYAKASPEGFKAFGGVYVYLQKCGLPKELVYLVYLRVSQINGCAYCIDMHSRDLLKLGVAGGQARPGAGVARRGRSIQCAANARARLGGNRDARGRNRRSRCRL